MSICLVTQRQLMDFTRCAVKSLPDVRCWKQSYTVVLDAQDAQQLLYHFLCTCVSLRGSYLCQLLSQRGFRIAATNLQAGKQAGEVLHSHEQLIILL